MSKARLASDIEHAVLVGLAGHKMYREIAEAIGATKEEVRACCARLAVRLGCSTKLDLIEKAQKLGYGRRFAETAGDHKPKARTFRDLSERQAAVLEVLIKHADHTGAVDLTYQQIADQTGLHDKRSVEWCVSRLTLCGYISRGHRQAKSIRLVWAKLNPLRAAMVAA